MTSGARLRGGVYQAKIFQICTAQNVARLCAATYQKGF